MNEYTRELRLKTLCSQIRSGKITPENITPEALRELAAVAERSTR